MKLNSKEPKLFYCSKCKTKQNSKCYWFKHKHAFHYCNFCDGRILSETIPKISSKVNSKAKAQRKCKDCRILLYHKNNSGYCRTCFIIRRNKSRSFKQKWKK